MERAIFLVVDKSRCALDSLERGFVLMVDNKSRYAKSFVNQIFAPVRSRGTVCVTILVGVLLARTEEVLVKSLELVERTSCLVRSNS